MQSVTNAEDCSMHEVTRRQELGPWCKGMDNPLLTVAVQPTTSDHSVNFTCQKRCETSNVITLIVTVASVASNYQMTVNIYDSVLVSHRFLPLQIHCRTLLRSNIKHNERTWERGLVVVGHETGVSWSHHRLGLGLYLSPWLLHHAQGWEQTERRESVVWWL